MNEKSFFDPATFGLDDDDLIPESIALSVISAAGGTVTGRTRLQKLVFLLDKLGLNSGFDYSYHHYGPYSSALVDAVDFAKAFGLIKEEFNYRADGARYSVFTLENKLKNNPKKDFLSDDKIKSAFIAMNESSATVLELAATAHWLKYDEKITHWENEIVKRKGRKTEDGRLGKAINLLDELGLNLNKA